MYVDSNTEKEKFAHDLLGHLPTGIGIFDLTDNVIKAQYINDGYYQMIGEQRDERTHFLGEHTLEAVHPNDRAKLVSEAKSAIREKRMVDCRVRISIRGGTYLWLGIRANHVPIATNTERFYAVYYNIQDYVRAEEAKSTLASILDNIPNGVALFSGSNSKAHLEYANPGFYKLHRGSKEYWSKQSDNPIDWIIPQDRDMFLQEFNAVSNGQKKEGRVIYRALCGDGKQHWLSALFRQAYEQDGQQFFYTTFVDMDELKNLEDARDENRKRYEAAVEEANLTIWEYDIKKHQIVIADNEFSSKSFGCYGITKTMGNIPQSLLPYIDDKHVDAFLEMYRKIDAGAPKAACNVWYRLSPKLEPRYMHISYLTIFDNDGKPKKAYGIGQNITAQKLAQDEYDNMRSQLTHSTPNLLSSFQLNLSKNLYISGINSYPGIVEKLQRTTADEHIAAGLQMITNAKIREKALKTCTCANLLKRFQNGEREFSLEYSIVSQEGGYKWVTTTLHMLQNPQTRDIECITYTTDNTKRKRSEEIIARMSSATSDFIGIVDTANNSFEILEKFHDFNKIPIGKVIPYDEAKEIFLSLYVAPAERADLRTAIDLKVLRNKLLTKSRNIISYNFYDPEQKGALQKKQFVYSWLDDEQRELLIIQQDITDAYHKEQEQIASLEAAKRAADAASKTKSAFISQMSHDIRTPINGIIGMSYLARGEANPPKTIDYLNKIDISSKFLLGLINDILDMTKAESGKIELHLEPYPVSEFNKYLDAVIKPLCQEKNQHFVVKQEALGTFVPLADKLRTNQIIFNLLSNAVKFTPEGGTITYKVYGELLSSNRVAIEHTISDNGIGMSKEFQKAVFEPFTQEGRNDSSERRGSGLGLAIVKKLVDIMGGNITVHSQMGKGSTFVVKLEFDTVSPNSVSQTEQAITNDLQTDSSVEGKHILVCEDHPLNQEIVKALLLKRGAYVEIAEDGAKGLELFKNSPLHFYDAILMDIRMPILNGYETTLVIRTLERADAKTVPIIAMTADAFAEDIRKCLKCGMDAHISKPLDPLKLSAIIAGVIIEKARKVQS